MLVAVWRVYIRNQVLNLLLGASARRPEVVALCRRHCLARIAREAKTTEANARQLVEPTLAAAPAERATCCRFIRRSMPDGQRWGAGFKHGGFGKQVLAHSRTPHVQIMRLGKGPDKARIVRSELRAQVSRWHHGPRSSCLANRHFTRP